MMTIDEIYVRIAGLKARKLDASKTCAARIWALSGNSSEDMDLRWQC
ncbi:MAG: hypothetical protein OEU25_00470 [Rhodospirillales bacterium]|nr:hypothetical protein [Rhodospirillales bacterium]